MKRFSNFRVGFLVLIVVCSVLLSGAASFFIPNVILRNKEMIQEDEYTSTVLDLIREGDDPEIHMEHLNRGKKRGLFSKEEVDEAIVKNENNKSRKALEMVQNGCDPKNFKKYLKIHPRDVQVHGFMFDIYQKQKKTDLAFREAQILSKLRPKEMKYYTHQFEYLNRRGDYKKMIGTMKTGLKSLPNNLKLRQYLVVAYLKTGQEDLALDQMKRILKKKPRDVTLLLQIASLQEKKGESVEALRTYKKILDISSKNREAKKAYLRLLLQQAKTEEKEENYQKALESYKKILDVSPTHEEASEAYLRLRLKVLPGGSKES